MVQLVDELGKEVFRNEYKFEEANQDIRIDLSSIKNGNYFLRFTNESGIQEVKKILLLK